MTACTSAFATEMPFVDTNVLLYALSHDPTEAAKARTANELLARRDVVLSAQVLGEFFVQATRVTRSDHLSIDQARRLVESFTRFPIVPITGARCIAANTTAQRWQLSYRDAAIIEAARGGHCNEIWTEDLHNGQDFDGVHVTNPFTPTN